MYTVGCEYGDQVTWCSTVDLTASRCQPSDLGVTCCASCHALDQAAVLPQPSTPPSTPATPQTSPDCPAGDTQTYCATIDSYNCYLAAQQCCISCAKYETNITGM